MLDRQWLRAHPDVARAGAAKKKIDAPIDRFLALDQRRREVKTELDAKRAELNAVSKSIGALMGQGKRDEAEAAKARAKALSDAVREGEEEERRIDAEVAEVEAQIPNVPHESVPEGESEADNVVVRTWGEHPTFDFEPKPHWEICRDLGLVDFERGAKIAGSGFIVYTGLGARLQRGLIAFMLDHATLRRGYREVYPPYLVAAHCLEGTGDLPKFEEDLYKASDDLYLIPTAETPVTNLFRDEILSVDDLTMNFAAYSACFRREAGAAGKDTRGLQRIHQFDKVELVKYCLPEDSYHELEQLTADAESVLQLLEIPYRVSLMCGPEMSFKNSKQYDLEIWAPALNKHLEVSSSSNFEAFQARRMNLRFRRAQGEKPEFVHTLNASGVALPRLFASILENFQQPDGSVVLPEALRPYVGVERLVPDAVPKPMGRWSKPRSKSVDLTPREQDVALLVSDGFSNRQIADRLSISEQWVANVLRAVSQKLGTSNRTELALRVRSRYR